jgi:hypothetical protein
MVVMGESYFRLLVGYLTVRLLEGENWHKSRPHTRISEFKVPAEEKRQGIVAGHDLSQAKKKKHRA